MCGISGCWSWRLQEEFAREVKLVDAMSSSLAHRGPDGSGLWSDSTVGIVLGHRRLSIIDLTEYGKQPMLSHSERLVLSFNGEIYNFRELRKDLEQSGSRFSGYSDTEVMLEAIEQWGLDTAVEKFNGMFAFALWDRHNRRLSLIRDRMGKKPLYYTISRGRVLFASEMRALLCDSEVTRDIDTSALTEYFRYGFVAAPRSILEGVHKVLPGEMVHISRDGEGRISTSRRRFWSPLDLHAGSVPYEGSYQSAIRELKGLISDAVRIRLESDVPLGAFLSGGIDSSLIVALMRDVLAGPVRTFTIGFDKRDFDESAHARSVAQVLGTHHTEVLLSARDVLDLVPVITQVFDEPFSDASQLPTLLVSKIAREFVTVALSGDGGDEWFGGYSRYTRYDKVAAAMRSVPRFLRHSAASTFSAVSRSMPGALRLGQGDSLRRRLSRAADLLRATTPDALYECLLSHWEDPGSVVDSAPAWRSLSHWAPGPGAARDSHLWMMLVDAGFYLPDDILVKVDRTSMSVGLESRSPLLDHRLAAFAVSLPDDFRFDARGGKRILRDLVAEYLPREIVERPKQGFAVPIGDWMRGPLRQWAGDHLSRVELGRSGLLMDKEVLRRWEQHQQGEWDWSASLWDVLMFQSWFRDLKNVKAVS